MSFLYIFLDVIPLGTKRKVKRINSKNCSDKECTEIFHYRIFI